VLRFVVELGDGRRYPVEMRGDEIRGLVADGHRVAVDLSALERGTVRTTHVRNLTTAADVETWSPPPWKRAARAATRGQVVSGILTAGIVTGAGTIYRLARPGKKEHKTLKAVTVAKSARVHRVNASAKRIVGPRSASPLPGRTVTATTTTTTARATHAESGSHDVAVALGGGLVVVLMALLVLFGLRQAGDRRRRLLGAAAGLAVGVVIVAVAIHP
jgi:hypothetical protein